MSYRHCQRFLLYPETPSHFVQMHTLAAGDRDQFTHGTDQRQSWQSLYKVSSWLLILRPSLWFRTVSKFCAKRIVPLTTIQLS
jgi:hypothetical protein